MITTIYVVRHADRGTFDIDYSTGKYTPRIATITGVPTDVSLVGSGQEQSKELAKHLCAIDPPIDRIYSSPFTRCLQTIQPTASRLFAKGEAGGHIRIHPGLGEFFGKAIFEHPHPPTLEQLSKPDYEWSLDIDYKPDFTHDKNGEYVHELQERVRKTIGSIIKELDAEPQQPKTLLVCAHAAIMIMLGRALTGKIPEDPDVDDFQCYTASLSTFKRNDSDAEDPTGNWTCTGNAETHFLPGGPNRGWKFNGEESFISFDQPTDTSKL